MYLLLRNNKQSGPHSFDELKSMGLKAYDLVWLEGKSAAWRYPCEIDELKSFAPPVDEQPFDRFYRKPSAAGATAASSAGSVLAVRSFSESPIPVTVESTKTPGKRIIYVTMPAGKSPSTLTPMREPVREPIQPMREPLRERVQPIRELVFDPIPPAPIDDYSTRTDAATVVDLLPRRKPRTATHAIRFLAIGACILALLAAGIFIGLSLNKDTLPFSSHVVAKIPPANTDPAIVHRTAQALPAPASVTPAVTNDQAKPVDSSATAAGRSQTTGEPQTQSSEIAKSVISRKTNPKTGRLAKDRLPRSMNQAYAPKKDSAAGGSASRESIHRADVETTRQNNVELPDKEAAKVAMATQVSVGASGYSVGTFGGITDLQLTVTNRSVYPLDLVIVEVRYIQANKKIYKTENLFFRGIGAGSALMQAAPRSSRGVKVQYKITNISSKELGLSYSGI